MVTFNKYVSFLSKSGIHCQLSNHLISTDRIVDIVNRFSLVTDIYFVFFELKKIDQYASDMKNFWFIWKLLMIITYEYNKIDRSCRRYVRCYEVSRYYRGFSAIRRSSVIKIVFLMILKKVKRQLKSRLQLENCDFCTKLSCRQSILNVVYNNNSSYVTGKTFTLTSTEHVHT